MKKTTIAVMTMTLGLAFASTAWASFDQYYDYQNADGSYSYYFDEGVTVTMNEHWYQNTFVKADSRGATFFQKSSYDAYQAEGVEGGRLFSIGASVNTSFQNLPSFDYIGFDENTVMNYYVEYPTDYQAYAKDEAIRSDYDLLWDEKDDVVASIQIGVGSGSDSSMGVDNNTAIEAEPQTEPVIISFGDYGYYENKDNETATIAEYNGNGGAVEIPSEINGRRITDIGANAFEYKEMTSLFVPDTVTSIHREAFEYSVITDSVRLPKDIIIQDDAFAYAELPSEITLPERTIIDESAFGYCETIEKVNIGPGSIVHGRAFGYCDKLNQVVCGTGTKLESQAFEYCDLLGKVILCGNVETVSDTFSYCGKIEMTTAAENEYDTLVPAAADTTGGSTTGGSTTGGTTTGGTTENGGNGTGTTNIPDIGAFLTGGKS